MPYRSPAIIVLTAWYAPKATMGPLTIPMIRIILSLSTGLWDACISSLSPYALIPQKDLIEFHPDGTIDPAVIQLSSSEQKITLSSIEMRGMMTKVDNE